MPWATALQIVVIAQALITMLRTDETWQQSLAVTGQKNTGTIKVHIPVESDFKLKRKKKKKKRTSTHIYDKMKNIQFQFDLGNFEYQYYRHIHTHTNLISILLLRKQATRVFHATVTSDGQ